MDINQQEYDRLPVAIRQGALHLWGTHLSSYSRFGQIRQLYSFSGFFVEVCYLGQQLSCIRTFSTIERLEPYIEQIDWQDLLN